MKLCKVTVILNSNNLDIKVIPFEVINEFDDSFQVRIPLSSSQFCSIKTLHKDELHSNYSHSKDNCSMIIRQTWCREEDVEKVKKSLINDITMKLEHYKHDIFELENNLLKYNCGITTIEL